MSNVYTLLKVKENNNIKILYAIVDQTNLKEKHELLFNKMYDMTYFNTLKISKKINFFKNIDECLSNSLDYDLVFIQSVGNFIQYNILKQLIYDYYEKNNDFFILGFVLDWEAELNKYWLECHHQMLLVNVKKWKELDCPIFGNWEIKTEYLPNYSRSIENFHDNYTPFWVKGEEGLSLKTRTKQGWNFIKTALLNKIKIDNFSNNMRDCRLYIYPETNSDLLYESIINKDSSKLINSNQKKFILNIDNDDIKQIWIYNSEHYNFINNVKNISTYFGPASGFKYLNILKHNDDTKIVFYDFNKDSLDWIEYLKNDWDGENYNLFLNKQPEYMKKKFKYINGSLEENEKLLNNYFKKDFKYLWNKFKKSKTEFIHMNLLNNNDVLKLINLTVGNKPMFYYSNIFFNNFLILKYSLKEIEKKHLYFLNIIKFKYKQIITEGTDHLGNWMITNEDINIRKRINKKLKTDKSVIKIFN